MKIITISKKKYKDLQLLDLPREVCNTEARIYDYEHQGQKKIIKNLYLCEGEMFGSKLYTVETLDTNKKYLPESFVIPDSLVSVNGDVVGFTVPKVEGITLAIILNDPSISLKEKLYYLKKIGELLEQLKQIREYTPLKDIYINDLQESNFIINPDNRSLKTIDLDSCKIGTNSPFPSRYMTESDLIHLTEYNKYIHNDNFKKNEGNYIANAESDMYCYIIMILNFLLGNNISRVNLTEYYSYLNYLSSIGIDKELIDCFEKILRYEPNTNPVHFLDTLDYTQVGRAKENVYKLVKSKNR